MISASLLTSTCLPWLAMAPDKELSFGERVAWALTKSRKTALAVSRKIGCSHVALGNWKSDKVDSAMIGADLLLRFADETGAELRWLLTGEGERLQAVKASDPYMKRIAAALTVMQERAPYNVERAVELIEISAKLLKEPPPER